MDHGRRHRPAVRGLARTLLSYHGAAGVFGAFGHNSVGGVTSQSNEVEITGSAAALACSLEPAACAGDGKNAPRAPFLAVQQYLYEYENVQHLSLASEGLCACRTRSKGKPGGINLVRTAQYGNTSAAVLVSLGRDWGKLLACSGQRQRPLVTRRRLNTTRAAFPNEYEYP